VGFREFVDYIVEAESQYLNGYVSEQGRQVNRGTQSVVRVRQ
jgi:hypothetical protein